MNYMGKSDPWGVGHAAFYESTSRSNQILHDTSVTLEPCNYVSNIAYYHGVLKICDYEDWYADEALQYDVAKSLSTIAVGSAFMHKSFTQVGAKLDNYMIGVIAYLGYQISMQDMPNKSVLLDGLQWEPRTKNVTMVIDNITKTIINEPIREWERVLDHEDYPREYY